MNEPSRPYQPVIGIVTAMPEEHDPVIQFLSRPKTVDIPNDQASYTIGTMPSADPKKPHQVVVTQLVGTGNTGAANACTHLARSFPSLRFLIMVGTAAGIPDVDHPNRHVRLGDVVVAKGVVEYDHVDDGPGEVRQRGSHAGPSAHLINHARALESASYRGARPWEPLIDEARRARDGARFARPPDSTDVVYRSDSNDAVLPHPDRAESGHTAGCPKVHEGWIGSGNTALSNMATRTRLAEGRELRAFDMETAGVASSARDGLEWFAVRGISDYGDARRTTTWRNYACLAAAAYTRALLEKCPPQPPRVSPPAPTSLGCLVAVAVGIVAMIGVLFSFLAWNRATEDVQITDRITVENAAGLGNGDVATVKLPSSPQRDYVDLIIRLENPSAVGDCVHSALLDLVPVVDGQEGQRLDDQHPGEEILVDIGEMERTATIAITVDIPDDSCRVDLSVAEAVLHN